MLLKILTREKKITETSCANSEQKHSEKLSWPGWLTYSGVNRLQLDVCNLSLGKRHLVNAYEVEAGTV